MYRDNFSFNPQGHPVDRTAYHHPYRRRNFPSWFPWDGNPNTVPMASDSQRRAWGIRSGGALNPNSEHLTPTKYEDKYIGNATEWKWEPWKKIGYLANNLEEYIEELVRKVAEHEDPWNAAHRNDVGVVDAFLTGTRHYKPNVNEMSQPSIWRRGRSKLSPMSLLYTAAANGSLDVVKLLCAGFDTDGHNANVNLIGHLWSGSTPLHVAAEKGHNDVVRFLLSKGAKKRPNMAFEIPDIRQTGF